jgi:hypothetical protein
VPLDAGRLHELLHPRRHEHVEAVAGVEDAQAGGLLGVFGSGDRGEYKSEQYEG